MKCDYVWKKGIVLIVTAALLLAGCGGKDVQTAETKTETDNTSENQSQDTKQASSKEGIPNGDTVEHSDKKALAEELKKKYEGAEIGEFDGNVIKVARNEAIEIKIGYNPWDRDEHIYDSFVIYQDAELKYPLDQGLYEWNDDTGILTINPPLYGLVEADSSEVDLSGLEGSYIYGDEENGWGIFSQYYLAANVDIETGDPIDTPVITVVKIEAEIPQAPQLVFDQTEDGFARFTWKEVPGAEGYLLFMVDKDHEMGFSNYSDIFADVKGTEWTSETEAHEFEGRILSLNERFVQYYTSDDNQMWIDENAAELNEFLEDIAYDEYAAEYFGMIAYNSEGCSPVSNLLSAKDLSHMLPTERARYADEEEYFGIEGTLGLPAMMSVTMGDGTTAQRVIDYDFDSMEKEEEFNRFTIIGKGMQTPFAVEFHAYQVDFATLESDLEQVRARQEKLKNKGGNVAPSLEIGDSIDENSPKEEPEKEETTPETEKEDGIIEIKVTANSAMSEYIALQMLETEEKIDLSAFPESADTDKIVDAFFEAQYQNPLVLGVQGGGIDPEERLLFVEYDFDKQTTEKKQEAILAKVEEITDEIIKEGMSDTEKEMAINAYLCENGQYDDAALENAEQYSFTMVDENFYDSFTAYGILVDGVGVCASYSAAFKLLADAAGLDSIVVTGYLDGSVPHAWNKVKVEGQWYIVDSTNNDNDILENALLNLSDAAAYGTLVENDNFVIKNSLGNYAAKEDVMEYYHVTGRYYEKDEIVDELSTLLVENGEAVLRTDYDIDDEAFYEIAQQVADQSKENLSGFYWMGVIRLQK